MNSAPAARIDVVSGNAQSAVVGTGLAQPLVVKVTDTNDNAVAGFAVAWTVATGAGQISTGATTTGPDGKASITATLGTLAGSYTFTAAGSGLTGSPTTFTAAGIPDAATQLVLAGPGATTAGDAQPFTLSAKDQYGNVAVGYRGAVTFTSTDGAATLPTPYTFSADDAGIHQFSVTLKTAGSRSVTAGDGSLTISKSGITVNPASAVTLAVAGFANTVTAGTAGTVTVTALDTFGNTATGYVGTVDITTDNPNATLPEPNHTFTAGDGGVHVFPVTLKGAADPLVTTFSITATDTVSATITGSQTGIVVNPDVATTLQVLGFNNPATAGNSGFFIVAALDAFDNTATGYRGTVHISSSDGAAVLPANRTYTVTDAGVHTFSITLKTAAASASITATDTVTATITGSQTAILVNPGNTTKLLVTGFPNPASADTGGTVTVTAADANNNTTPSYRGTVQVTTDNLNSTLPKTHTFIAGDNGVFTFTAVILKKSSPPNYKITATDTVTTSITGSQTAIVVNAGATTKLLVTGFPNPASADTGGPVTVTAQDANDNTTPAYRGTVQLTSDNTNTNLPLGHTFVAGDNGVFTFTTVLLKKASPPSYTITATDTPNALTASQTGIVVNPGATFKFQVAGFPNPVFAGTPGSVTVTAQDANNNTTPAYVGTVQFGSTDLAASLPADYPFTVGDAGMNSFAVILNTESGATSITATDLGNGTITGGQTVVVNAGPLVFGATATLILDGSRNGLIFIAGGGATSTGANPFSNTWFYDPADSTLTAGPPLAFARSLHTATAIGGGQVLVAGGTPNSITGFREFELCSLDGATPSCAASGGSVATLRCNAAAALVSATPARVLIAGGDNCASSTALASWDLWDSAVPATPVVNPGTGPNKLALGRRLLTATVVGAGKVLLAGGSASSATADVFTLDSTTPGNSTVGATTGAPTGGRQGHSATLLTSISTACPSGSATVPCVLLAGGNLTAGKTWEIYDASTDRFPRNAATGAPPNHDLVVTSRQFHAAAAFANGKVLLGGGSTPPAQSTTEVFDPAAATLSFTSGIGLQVPRTRPVGVYAPVQDLLVLIGGSSVGPSTEQVTTP